ncbi:unnamed protein product [Closterium sp. NIES-65]|nr:unnamed protein product [Closterium sp. NIES-65]
MACKQIRTAGLSEAEMADLQREIYSLSLLGSHENILSLAHVYADEKTVYLVTELCNGGDLFDLVDRSGDGLDEASAAKIFVQIVRAVRWCHAHRIVHRDIKPENILLTKSMTVAAGTTGSSSASIADNLSVRLADFGLAFQLKPGCAMVGIGGSMPYEAPEMLAEQPYNTKADVWSLGVLLYSMLTSTWPAFPGNRRQLTPNDFRSAGEWGRDGGEGWGGGAEEIRGGERRGTGEEWEGGEGGEGEGEEGKGGMGMVPWALVLAVVKEGEVLGEMAAEQWLGEEGKWSIVAGIEAAKAAIRLLLLHRDKWRLLIGGGSSENPGPSKPSPTPSTSSSLQAQQPSLYQQQLHNTAGPMGYSGGNSGNRGMNGQQAATTRALGAFQRCMHVSAELIHIFRPFLYVLAIRAAARAARSRAGEGTGHVALGSSTCLPFEPLPEHLGPEQVRATHPLHRWEDKHRYAA